MKNKNNSLLESWKLVKNNKILFLPNIAISIIHIIAIVILGKVTGLFDSLISSGNLSLQISLFSIKNIIMISLYITMLFLVDNYFLAAKYGMIKELIRKKKISIKNSIDFANKHYLTTLGIHILSYLIVFVPLILLFVLMYILIPINQMFVIRIFSFLIMIYFIYITIRLLFIYPVMAFENKGAYQSLTTDFHFVKTHANHTLFSWAVVVIVAMIIAITKENFIKAMSLLSQQIAFLGFLLIALIFLIELTVSVWEHVFIFKSYIDAKKIKKK